jgi:hypothetical protein
LLTRKTTRLPSFHPRRHRQNGHTRTCLRQSVRQKLSLVCPAATAFHQTAPRNEGWGLRCVSEFFWTEAGRGSAAEDPREFELEERTDWYDASLDILTPNWGCQMSFRPEMIERFINWRSPCHNSFSVARLKSRWRPILAWGCRNKAAGQWHRGVKGLRTRPLRALAIVLRYNANPPDTQKKAPDYVHVRHIPAFCKRTITPE